jgi:hypothetical protein
LNLVGLTSLVLYESPVTIVPSNMKRYLFLWIGVPLLAAVPLRDIGNFGQDERRRDRIEDLVEIKHARTVGPARGEVGEIFVGAPFSDDARHHVRRSTARRGIFINGNSLLNAAVFPDG